MGKITFKNQYTEIKVELQQKKTNLTYFTYIPLLCLSVIGEGTPRQYSDLLNEFYCISSLPSLVLHAAMP